jgi:hypothetical protein
VETSRVQQSISHNPRAFSFAFDTVPVEYVYPDSLDVHEGGVCVLRAFRLTRRPDFQGWLEQ